MNIKHIATQANNLNRKPNKEKAFATLCNMIERDEFNCEDLATLYAFFLPTIRKPKNKEQWIQLAVAKNDVRHYLKNAHVREKQLEATDGIRLHICDTELDDGFYDKAMNRLEFEGRFPNTDRVIPDTAKRKSVELGDVVVNATPFKVNGKVLPCLDVTFDNETTLRFQKKFWDDAVSIMTEDAEVFYDDSIYPILIIENNIKAVLMSIRN